MSACVKSTLGSGSGGGGGGTPPPPTKQRTYHSDTAAMIAEAAKRTYLQVKHTRGARVSDGNTSLSAHAGVKHVSIDKKNSLP